MEKEVRKCNRGELITMVERLNNEINMLQNQLMDQENALKEKDARIQELEEKQNNRIVELEECGSLADVAMKTNGILLAAQETADQYIENIKHREAQQNSVLARKKLEAERYDLRTRAEADDYYRNKISEANVEAEKTWEQIAKKMESFYETHAGLKELMQEVGMIK